nr:MAG: RNA-dependent RNA polymerase [Rhabdoviridae sp.]
MMEFPSDYFLDSGLDDFQTPNFIDMQEINPMSESIPNGDTFCGIPLKDFNLDSPLIPELRDNMISYLNSAVIPKCYRSMILRNGESLKDLVRDSKLSIPIIYSGDIHQWFFSGGLFQNIYYLFRIVREDIAYQILEDCSSQYSNIWCLIEEFNKRTQLCMDENMLRNSFLNLSPLNMSNYMFQLFYLYINLNYMTGIWNSIDDVKGEQFKDKRGVIRIDRSSNGIRLRNLSNKDIFLVENFLLVDDILIDKNFFLMLKDILLGRFMTLIVLSVNLSSKYSEDIVGTITLFFDKMDEYISSIGNESYNFIKMIEAFVNLRWMEISERKECMELHSNFKKDLFSKLSDCKGNQMRISEILAIIQSLSNPDDLSVIFGSFRLFGHPYINIEEGLNQLRDNCRIETEIDEVYAKKLGDDLIFLVLKREFNKTGKWYVDVDKLDSGHPLHPFIMGGTWPNGSWIRNNEFSWLDLPIIPIFEIPTDIDLSSLYSDKSHSMNLSEVMDHIRMRPEEPVPTRKVLNTLLDKPSMDPIEFLRKISREGISPDSLVIGLKEKERELKIKGRFYSLMSWEVRDYFVLTEHLIKLFFLPLFEGITMGDGLNTIIGKILNTTAGQELINKLLVTIANMMDFEKWNNFQRHEAVKYVFRAMDKLLGLENCIERSHQIFEKCFFYSVSRPDLYLDSDLILQMTGGWKGQKGGLEGVRQKGWTVVGLLSLARKTRFFNVLIRFLAQGDNQIFITKYKIQDNIDYEIAINEIIRNNASVMRAINEGSKALGLNLKTEETFSASHFMIYGKVPVLNGNIINLETKKWTRLSILNNDQVPSISNIMQTVGSTALASSQFEDDIRGSFILYLVSASMLYSQYASFHPIFGFDYYFNRYPTIKETARWLFVDRSIGGYSGMSPTRFLIRRFPDPITEAFCFWIPLTNSKNKEVHDIALSVLNPKLKEHSPIEKLIEDPARVNVRTGGDIDIMIREEIKKSLVMYRVLIKNDQIRYALEYECDHKAELYNFLDSIKPCFPRFLSSFKEGTLIGLADSIISLIHNSRTLRMIFRKDMRLEVYKIYSKFEREFFSYIKTENNDIYSYPTCSSEHADYIRRISWNREIIGETVPHPYEYHSLTNIKSGSYLFAGTNTQIEWHPRFNSGSMKPYLGSRTKESTSTLTPWEKEIKNPLSKRAYKLLRVIGWFVNINSNLSVSIINNLEMLTKSDIKQPEFIRLRTGSALHRFSTTRQSNGGFSPIAPNVLRYIYATMEDWKEFLDQNYDFMFQASMIYGQTVLVNHLLWDGTLSGLKFGIGCNKCMRPIDDIKLESQVIYNPKSYNNPLSLLKTVSPNFKNIQNPDVFSINSFLTSDDTARNTFWIGFFQGFIFSYQVYTGVDDSKETSLFPIVVAKKVEPEEYFQGIYSGIRISSLLNMIRRYRSGGDIDPRKLIDSGTYASIIDISRNPYLILSCQSNRLRDFLCRQTGYILKGFPVNSEEVSVLIKRYLFYLFSTIEDEWISSHIKQRYPVVIYQDIEDPHLNKHVILLMTLFNIIPPYPRPLQKERMNRYISDIRFLISTEDATTGFMKTDILQSVSKQKAFFKRSVSEIRHSLQVESINYVSDTPVIEEECVSEIDMIEIARQSAPTTIIDRNSHHLENPIMSGLRLFQCSTGAHYKIRSILSKIKEEFGGTVSSFLSLGDGSGGGTSCILRAFPNSRGLFNSLIGIDFKNPGGMRPLPPSAVSSVIEDYKTRCPNSDDYWEYPTNISDPEFVNGIGSQMISAELESFDLIFCDAEIINEQIQEMVELNGVRLIKNYLSNEGWVLWKTYFHRLSSSKLLEYLSSHFDRVFLCNSDFRSAYTSELYIVASGRNDAVLYNQFVDVRTLKECREYLNRDFSEDGLFIRALKIFGMDLMKGVPKSLHPRVDISFLMAFKASSHFYNELIQVLYPIDNNLLIRVFNYTYQKIWQPSGSSSYEAIGSLIPSTQDLILNLSLNLSVLVISSIIAKDSKMFYDAERLNNSSVDVYYHIESTKGGLYKLSGIGRALNLERIITKRIPALRRSNQSTEFLRILIYIVKYCVSGMDPVEADIPALYYLNEITPSTLYQVYDDIQEDENIVMEGIF